MIRIRCFGSCVPRWTERGHRWIFGGSIPSHPISARLYIASNIASGRASIFRQFGCRPISRFPPQFFFFQFSSKSWFDYWIGSFLPDLFSKKKRRKLLNALTVGLYGFIRTMCIIFNIPSQEFRVAQSIFRQFVDRFQDFFLIVERNLVSIIELNLSLKRKEESF